MADKRRLERVKGTPGIYRRGKSYVVVGYSGGRQVKRIAPTLAAARDVKAELRTQPASQASRSRTPVVEYCDFWLENYGGRTNRGLKPHTRTEYAAALHRAEFQRFFRGVRLGWVTADHLTEYGETLAAAGLSPRTVRNLLLPIRLMFATAHDRRHITHNPLAGIKVKAAMGSGAAVEVTPLQREEVGRLLAAYPRNEVVDRLLAYLLVLTGLRIGEALALRPEDFGPDCRTVRVERRLYKDGEAPPKSRQSRRTVPVAPTFAPELARFVSGVAPGSRIFPMAYSTAYRRFRRAAGQAGLVEGTAFHALRHTCASWLFASVADGGAGLNVRQVQKWLGHHSPEFTLATYIHLLQDELPEPTALAGLWPITSAQAA